MVFATVATQAQAQPPAQYLFTERKHKDQNFFLFLVPALRLAFALQQVKTKYRAG